MSNIAFIWTGIAYIQDVPARDLTADEARQYAEVITQQQLLTGLTIYRRSDMTEVEPDEDNPVEE